MGPLSGANLPPAMVARRGRVVKGRGAAGAFPFFYPPSRPVGGMLSAGRVPARRPRNTLLVCEAFPERGRESHAGPPTRAGGGGAGPPLAGGARGRLARRGR